MRGVQALTTKGKELLEEDLAIEFREACNGLSSYPAHEKGLKKAIREKKMRGGIYADTIDANDDVARISGGESIEDFNRDVREMILGSDGPGKGDGQLGMFGEEGLRAKVLMYLGEMETEGAWWQQTTDGREGKGLLERVLGYEITSMRDVGMPGKVHLQRARDILGPDKRFESGEYYIITGLPDTVEH